MKRVPNPTHQKIFVLLIFSIFTLLACKILSFSPGNGSGTAPTSTTGAENPSTPPAKFPNQPVASPTPTPTPVGPGLSAKFTLEIETHSSWTENGMTRSTDYFMSIPLENSAKGMMVGHGKATMKMIDTGRCVGEATFEVSLNVTATGTDPITFTGEGSQTVISNEEVCDGVKAVPATGTSPIEFAPVELPARDGATKTIHIPLGANGDFSQTYTLRIQ